MLLPGASGFWKASVSKGLCFALLAGTLLSIFFGVRLKGPIDINTFNMSLMIIPPCQFVSASNIELLFHLWFLYIFRGIEKQMSSAKFGAVVFILSVITVLSQIALSFSVVSGPYGIIYGLIVYVLFNYTVIRDQVSILALASVSLFFTDTLGASRAALCGVIAGIVYQMNIAFVQYFKFPSWLIHCLEKNMSFFQSLPVPRPTLALLHQQKAHQRALLNQQMIRQSNAAEHYRAALRQQRAFGI